MKIVTNKGRGVGAFEGEDCRDRCRVEGDAGRRLSSMVTPAEILYKRWALSVIGGVLAVTINAFGRGFTILLTVGGVVFTCTFDTVGGGSLRRCDRNPGTCSTVNDFLDRNFSQYTRVLKSDLILITSLGEVPGGS